jgi:soluble P-type ATPase
MKNLDHWWKDLWFPPINLWNVPHMENKTTAVDMDSLHSLLVTDLISKIKSGEATAAELNVARQLLKDNGIEATVAEGNQMGSLVDSLPFAGLKVVDYKK